MTEPESRPDDDQQDWDVERDGHMADHATDPDGEPVTIPWEG
jgi:hypothetical protein